MVRVGKYSKAIGDSVRLGAVTVEDGVGTGKGDFSRVHDWSMRVMVEESADTLNTDEAGEMWNACVSAEACTRKSNFDSGPYSNMLYLAHEFSKRSMIGVFKLAKFCLVSWE